MSIKKSPYIGLCTILLTPLLSSLSNAQTDVWSSLARSQFDRAASTLRVPCVVLRDENRNSVPGFAPAYALNLELVNAAPGNETFRLVDPIKTFAEIPGSCLDTLTLATDGVTVSYVSTSTEIDIDSAVYADKFYSLELQADLAAVGPLEFSVVSAESRRYTRPYYSAEISQGFPPNFPFPEDFIYDDQFIEIGRDAMNQGLVVLEASRIDIQCGYSDPDNLLEVVEVIGTNVRYRLKPSLNSTNNGESFSMVCTVTNLDLNQLDLTVPVIDWFIFF